MPRVFVGPKDGTAQPLPGIGYGPMSEAEFKERVDAYEAQFGEGGRGSVAASGLYKRVSESAAEEKAEEVTEALAAPNAEPDKEPE